MITIDPESSVPPFEQVRTSLAEQMADGTLPVGTRLPTVRGLADELGVAPGTVARAYRELEAASLVETRGRAGTFVSPGGSRRLEAARAAADRYRDEVHALGLSTDEALRIAEASLRA